MFENNSGDDSDDLSCCDGESHDVHTEDLIRRGVTRQIGKVYYLSYSLSFIYLLLSLVVLGYCWWLLLVIIIGGYC